MAGWFNGAEVAINVGMGGTIPQAVNKIKQPKTSTNIQPFFMIVSQIAFLWPLDAFFSAIVPFNYA